MNKMPVMNGYQRIRVVLNGEWPDKRPVMLHNFMMAAREAGLTMKEYRENPDKAAKAVIQAVEKYNTDGVLIDIDTATLAGAVGVKVDFPDDEPARTYGIRLSSLQEVIDLKPANISKNERIQIWLETCRVVKNHFGNEKFVRGNCDQAPFSLASMMRGPAEWMIDLVSGNDLIFGLLDYCADACFQFITLMAETGVDMISNGDSPAGPEMISPEMYRRFALPYEKKLVDKSHELGLPYCLHICGNTDMILEDIINTGTDTLELDYKTDIQKVYNLCRDKRTFIGNIDPSGVLARGSKKDVEEKVNELLDIYKGSPRLIVNAGCAIPPDTPGENIERLIEVTRSF